ncbi:MAG: hypothetical protein ACJZ5B_06570 [Candidatus Poseidoniaceae archaeon]
MGLDELDLLKTTLLEIEEIDRKIVHKKSQEKNDSLELKNLKDVEIPSKESLKTKVEYVTGDFDNYSKEKIRRILRNHNWKWHHSDDIDLLKLEYVKMKQYSKYMGDYYIVGENYGTAKSKISRKRIDKKFDVSKNSDLHIKTVEQLKQICRNENLPSSGNKMILKARILYGPYRYSFLEKTDLSNHTQENIESEIEAVKVGLEEEKENYKKEKKQIIETYYQKEGELFELTSSFFGGEGKTPNDFFNKQEKQIKQDISYKRNSNAGMAIFPILIMVCITIFSGLDYIYTIIVAIVVTVFSKLNLKRIDKFESSEIQRLNDLKLELEPQNETFQKLNDELNSARSAKDRTKEKYRASQQVKKAKLFRLEDMLDEFINAKKQFEKDLQKQDKDIKSKIKAQKSVEIERERKTKNLEKLKSEIKKLEGSKKQLWEQIKHLIPYSNLI